jgi:hypothetical protein
LRNRVVGTKKRLDSAVRLHSNGIENTPMCNLYALTPLRSESKVTGWFVQGPEPTATLKRSSHFDVASVSMWASLRRFCVGSGSSRR